MSNVSNTTAFVAGILSFVSPCVLPLVPAYISFVSGMIAGNGDEPEKRRGTTWITFINSLAFVAGFSIVFVILGASATFLGSFLGSKVTLVSQIAGAIIVIFGLHTMGVFRIKALDIEKRFNIGKKRVGVLGSLLVGFAFAFGWTPCIGPVLGAILALASAQDSVKEGMVLLSFYSAGLGIPFLLTSLGINQFFRFFGKVKKHFRTIEIVAGVFLVVVGLLIMTNNFQKLIYLIAW
ncbi:MAG: cytochrome c biogenesis protein CcdA [Candidatus Schekmanbacteria bacterium]|nr:cytochrome c biogenesis protein CcdA [Candidatus Schekmanbacteria bacterium]